MTKPLQSGRKNKLNERQVTARPENNSVDAPAIQIQQIKTREQFQELESEWDAFLLNTQTPSPFLSWDYLDVWWDVYGDKGFDVKLYIIRDSQGKLTGAIPLMISQKGAFAGARSKFRHLAFMGGVGDLAGESLELPALRGHEISVGKAAAGLISETFKGQWDVLYLFLVPHDSRSTNAMIRDLAYAGVPVKTVSSLPSPILPITSSWDDHMQSRSAKTRANVRRTRNRAIKNQDMKELKVGEDVPFEQAYEELVRLADLRWGSAGSQAFHTPEFVDFHWKLAPRYMKKGMLSFNLIELDGQYAGAVYDFIFDQKKWGYQIPWDPAFRSSSVGNLLNVLSLKGAFDQGLREIDFLPGESGGKNIWAKYARPLNIYEAACPRSMGGTLFSIARGIDRILKQKEKSLPA